MEFVEAVQVKEVASLAYRHGLCLALDTTTGTMEPVASYDLALATVRQFVYDARRAVMGVQASPIVYADDILTAEEAQAIWDALYAAHHQMMETV